jgi:hypothetical protein
MSLSKSETLRTLKPRLADPETFVSRAFGVVHRYARSHGDVRLRLGITGTGQFPNYRIEDAESGEHLGAFNGANHEPWPEGENIQGVGTWSKATMSRGEVEELLGEVRNFTRKAK